MKVIFLNTFICCLFRFFGVLIELIIDMVLIIDGGYGIFGTWDWNVLIYIILVLLVAIFCGKRRKFG